MDGLDVPDAAGEGAPAEPAGESAEVYGLGVGAV